MGSLGTQTVLHECGPMSYSKLTAPQKGFHIVMLQNLPVTDLTFMGEDHDVCVSRGERVHFLQEDFPFSVQQSVPSISSISSIQDCSVDNFATTTGLCRTPWKALIICL